MTYIKLISKTNTWFDAGTEVFDGSVNDYGKSTKRISSKDYYNNWEPSGVILGFGFRNGHWDMEVCPLDEFDIFYTKDKYDSLG